MNVPGSTLPVFTFGGLGDNGQCGIYVSENGVVRKVIDTNTPIPDRAENFNWEHRKLVETLFSYDDGGVLFEGWREGYAGVFSARADGEIIKLIDVNDTFEGKAIANAYIDCASIAGNRAGVWVQFGRWNGGDLHHDRA
jgi:hypothetical protein